MCQCGDKGDSLTVVVSFLHNQGLRVLFGERVAPMLPFGIPQGAILTPMLFNMLFNPFTQFVGTFGLDSYQYADDTHLHLLMNGQPAFTPDILAKG